MNGQSTTKPQNHKKKKLRFENHWFILNHVPPSVIVILIAIVSIALPRSMIIYKGSLVGCN